MKDKFKAVLYIKANHNKEGKASYIRYPSKWIFDQIQVMYIQK